MLNTYQCGSRKAFFRLQKVKLVLYPDKLSYHRQMLTGTAYDVNHGTIYSMKEDTYDNIQNFEHGFCGSNICRFNVKNSDSIEMLEAEGISALTPLQIPRGLTVITFEFELGENATVPLFKNRSENKCIKIFPNFAVKRNIYPASMITQIPILSETKG